VFPVQVTEKPSQVGLVDFVLFCVKNPDTETAAQAIQPVVGPGITVMSLQNGIDAAECINAVVGIEHMIGVTTWISSSIESSGVIRRVS
jgi:2-dehydropantoate 2-reductase